MSLDQASEIVNCYINLMQNPTIGHYYSTSQLDINDFANATKLFTARSFYYSNPIVENYVSWADQGIIMYPMSFMSDYFLSELKKLDKSSQNYKQEKHNITFKSEEEQRNSCDKIETLDSFLKYLKQIGKSDPKFWHKVFEYLNLSCDVGKLDEISYLYQEEESLKETGSKNSSFLKEKKSQNIFNKLFKLIFRHN